MATETKLVCPECGVSMTNLDPRAHSLHHWPEYLDPAKSSREARERQKLTNAGGVKQAEYDASHKVGD